MNRSKTIRFGISNGSDTNPMIMNPTVKLSPATVLFFRCRSYWPESALFRFRHLPITASIWISLFHAQFDRSPLASVSFLNPLCSSTKLILSPLDVMSWPFIVFYHSFLLLLPFLSCWITLHLLVLCSTVYGFVEMPPPAQFPLPPFPVAIPFEDSNALSLVGPQLVEVWQKSPLQQPDPWSNALEPVYVSDRPLVITRPIVVRNTRYFPNSPDVPDQLTPSMVPPPPFPVENDYGNGLQFPVKRRNHRPSSSGRRSKGNRGGRRRKRGRRRRRGRRRHSNRRG